MGMTIAMAGKGGTGKTTVAGLAVKFLVQRGLGPVLAVDADANANLNEVLGVEVCGTLGEAREEMKKGGAPGMTKDVFIDMKVNQALVEASGYDLIVMGRPEGPGCYCAANHLLTNVVDNLTNNYKALVIDNEAGMEHLSRLITKHIDILYVVSDPSRRGLTAARRIWDLVDELRIQVKKKYLILNQLQGELSQDLKAFIEAEGLDLAGVVQSDQEIYALDQAGRPTSELGPENPAVAALFAIFERTIDGAGTGR